MLLLSRAGFSSSTCLAAVCLFMAPAFIGDSLRWLFSGYKELFLMEQKWQAQEVAPVPARHVAAGSRVHLGFALTASPHTSASAKCSAINL